MNEQMPSLGDMHCNKGQLKEKYVKCKVYRSILLNFMVPTQLRGPTMEGWMYDM